MTIPIVKDLSISDLAAFIGGYLEQQGVDVVLVGGACVSIYSKHAYISGDLDLITYHEGKKIKEALSRIGFRFTKNNYFVHSESNFILEFVNPPAAIGRDAITEFAQYKTNLGSIKLLTPTDCVKDRLTAYFYWNDEQSLEQALLVAREQTINLSLLEIWAKREKQLGKFSTFISLI